VAGNQQQAGQRGGFEKIFMKKIASFTVNHEILERGIYVSRRDGDITTFDLRMRKPYVDDLLTDIEMHSLEHLWATALRNGKNGSHVIYAGPMGCATGFYVLYRGLSDATCIQDITAALQAALTITEMPGNSTIECGNNRTLDLAKGQNLAKEYLAVIEGKSRPDVYE